MSNSFSQPLRPNDDIKPKVKKASSTFQKKTLTYHDFFNKKVQLKKMKMDELKMLARQNLLKVGGRKPVLIDRIENFFLLSKHISKIQSIMRMYLAKKFIDRGPAMKNRKLCVNDSDFVSLEPIEDIHWMDFYSFTDNKGFCYGFDINNLIKYFTNSKICNPFTKELINVDILKRIKKIHRINSFYKKKVSSWDSCKNSLETINGNVVLNTETIIKNRLSQLINKQVNERIVELFMEIDLLGNYTQSKWFFDLSKELLVRLSLKIYYIWNEYHIPYDLKRKICPYFNPTIYNVPHISTRINAGVTTLEYMRMYCITLFENIVYGSLDNEYRKIGVLHLLSLLTSVSRGASESMPWLVDVIVI